jgi:hypothetical protein
LGVFQAPAGVFIEHKSLFDYIQDNFSYDISQKFVSDLNTNYLPMLQECRAYYQSIKETAKLKKVDTIAVKILNVTEDKKVKAKYAGRFAAPDASPQRKTR